MSPKALDLGTPEHNTMIKDIGHVSVNFSVIPMFLLHNIQQAVVYEIKEREHYLVWQLKHSNNIIAYLNTKVKETEKKTHRLQQDMQRLEHVVALACHEFS